MVSIPVAGGLGIYAYYAHIGCDPLEEGLIDSPNEVGILQCTVINYTRISSVTWIYIYIFYTKKNEICLNYYVSKDVLIRQEPNALK